MKNYEKPVMNETKIQIEGVYAGSGENSPIEENQSGNNSVGLCPKNGYGNQYKYNGSCKNCALYSQAQMLGQCPLA